MASPQNLKNLKTPSLCTADFSLTPIGTASPSYSQQIADVQGLVRESGLKHQLHATGTTVDGSWDEISNLIGRAHSLVHGQGVSRVNSDIRINTRTDKTQSFEQSVNSVASKMPRSS